MSFGHSWQKLLHFSIRLFYLLEKSSTPWESMEVALETQKSLAQKSKVPMKESRVLTLEPKIMMPELKVPARDSKVLA
jgi:hypothetical protein